MPYKIEITPAGETINIKIKSRHCLDREFTVVVDKDGLHIWGNNPLSMTWEKTNNISVDTTT